MAARLSAATNGLRRSTSLLPPTAVLSTHAPLVSACGASALATNQRAAAAWRRRCRHRWCYMPYIAEAAFDPERVEILAQAMAAATEHLGIRDPDGPWG